MKTINVYVAVDGSRWDDPTKAAERDTLCAEVHAVMALLGPPVVDEGCRFANGEGHLPHNPHTVSAVRLAMWEVARSRLPDWMAKQEARPNFHGWATVDMSWLSRMLDDGGPICRAATRLMCIDGQGREWGQPYYAEHPHEARSQLPVAPYAP